MREAKTTWVLLNEHQIYMLLLAIRQYKKQPMRTAFAEYLRQAESKLRDDLHLIREEALRESDEAFPVLELQQPPDAKEANE